MATQPRLEENETVVVLVMNQNPYSIFLKQTYILDNIDEYHIVIKSDSGLDQRVYNRPTSTKYVLMFPTGEPSWHGNIPRTGGHGTSKKNASFIQQKESYVSSYATFEDLLNRKKEASSNIRYHDIAYTDDNMSMLPSSKKRKTISCRQYYVYKLQIREQDKRYILWFG
ncbi:hypothetical protein LIER_41438 [Lithospermum erythrorhizon]|uniref:Uncharacterized protein n=1 Tax=Lithospermum erythrorhizon TaxID=34254 RepID=A0AAV3R9B6_LITER